MLSESLYPHPTHKYLKQFGISLEPINLVKFLVIAYGSYELVVNHVVFQIFCTHILLVNFRIDFELVRVRVTPGGRVKYHALAMSKSPRTASQAC